MDKSEILKLSTVEMIKLHDKLYREIEEGECQLNKLKMQMTTCETVLQKRKKNKLKNKTSSHIGDISFASFFEEASYWYNEIYRLELPKSVHNINDLCGAMDYADELIASETREEGARVINKLSKRWKDE